MKMFVDKQWCIADLDEETLGKSVSYINTEKILAKSDILCSSCYGKITYYRIIIMEGFPQKMYLYSKSKKELEAI